MKRFYLLLSLLVSLQSFGQVVVDSFSKDGRVYYTIDKPSMQIRNFYPKSHFPSSAFVRYSVFNENIFNCDTKVEVVVLEIEKEHNDGNNLPVCSFYEHLSGVNFTDGFIHFPTTELEKNKIKIGEKLFFDGCYLYRNTTIVATPKHRSVRVDGLPKDTSYISHGILTDIHSSDMHRFIILSQGISYKTTH